MADPFDPPETHTGSHGKKGSGLNEKLGGAPVWVWGVGGAVFLIAIFLYIRHRNASATTAAATAATAGAGLAYDDPNQVDPNSASGETFAQEGYTTPSAVDAYLAGSTSGASAPVGLTPNGIPGPTTNTQWASLVADYLIGQGDDPSLVSNALNDFTHGSPLSTAEQAIVNTALQVFGEPPEGVIPVTATPTTTTAPPPTGVVTNPPPSGSQPNTPPPATGTTTPPVVTVPITYGKRADDAIQMVQNAGFTVSTSPARNASETYVSHGSSPEGGTRAPAGSHVVINVVQKTY
jgi:hypothetical protein